MIDDDDIEKALNWMRDNADEAAKASGEVIRAEEYAKSTLALVASGSGQETIAGQEREARLSAAYKKAIDEKVAATYADRKFRLLYAAAEAKIDVWRTQQSNARAEGRVG